MQRRLMLGFMAATLFFWTALPVAAFDDGPKTPVAKIELNDGDSLVFLGDSITHQCLYTQFVEDYFYTRYPTRRIHFYNAGIGGDKCGDALLRFEEVAAKKPKYVTVLLGMNDGQYQPFNQAIFNTYERDARKVVDKIRECGAIPVLMTPTMFDLRASQIIAARQTKAGKKPGPWPPYHLYYNSVLAYYGRLLQEIAYEGGYGFVDMFTPLNQITMRERKANANFTMIADAVHPGDAGQMVMACAFLEDMHPNRQVSNIRISLLGDRVRGTAQGGKLSAATIDGDRIRFQFAAESLPWVVPTSAELGDRLTNAGHQFSVERLIVLNLKPGKYTLKIDGQEVGDFQHANLARGIELQRNVKTPQYQQALKVATINQERNDVAIRPLRNQWLATRELRNVRNALVAKLGDATLTERKAKLEATHVDSNKKIEELMAKAKEYEDRIYAENQPKSHLYELAPATAEVK